MKTAGIWIDKKNAIIDILNDKDENIKLIISEVNEDKMTRGAESNDYHASQNGISKKSILKRTENQRKEYYTAVLSHVQDADQLLIMGPDETKESLLYEIKNHPEFHKKQVFIENADNLTVPQVRAKILGYFKSLVH